MSEKEKEKEKEGQCGFREDVTLWRHANEEKKDI
jgi:hypothetical protein